ncbi:hypothetical protein SLS62_006901 [Diatrype stigma]|uniref:FAD-binding PCMH-type domain-containing protein n=1 Tax=Diatrype stigma TaxID=117547 RepID=A0AAN9UMM5_9PEZI
MASCDPWQPRERPCTLGNYVSYAVAVSGPEDVVAALNFAEERDIRVVIRNTGHDYLGRSTGAGALAIWTHHLKSTEVVDWEDAHYQGKALKLGAGVQAFEALAAAKEAGLVVVTGECPTVGLAGGYIQAGGHSALSTSYGLAADNALSFEVVTPRGDVLTASGAENQDLYWALSGGGGGTFGLVTSVTMKAHPDHMVAGASFQVSATEEEPGRIFEVIDAFHEALPDIVDAGIMVIYFFGSGFLQVPALTAYGKSKEQVEQILLPLANSLAALGVALEPKYTEFPSYHDHYDHYWGPLPEGNIQVGTQLFGGRLISRSALANFSSAARQIAEEGAVFIGVGTDVSAFGGAQQQPQNSVLPQWRDSIASASLTLPWSFQAPFQEMIEAQRRITEVVQPIVEMATPGSGAYINEADFLQPDWQETFFGANYPELLRLKRKYDPASLLYARVGVGSEAYEVRSDGRMCRAKK